MTYKQKNVVKPKGLLVNNRPLNLLLDSNSKKSSSITNFILAIIIIQGMVIDGSDFVSESGMAGVQCR